VSFNYVDRSRRDNHYTTPPPVYVSGGLQRLLLFALELCRVMEKKMESEKDNLSDLENTGGVGSWGVPVLGG